MHHPNLRMDTGYPKLPFERTRSDFKDVFKKNRAPRKDGNSIWSAQVEGTSIKAWQGVHTRTVNVKFFFWLVLMCVEALANHVLNKNHADHTTFLEAFEEAAQLSEEELRERVKRSIEDLVPSNWMEDCGTWWNDRAMKP